MWKRRVLVSVAGLALAGMGSGQEFGPKAGDYLVFRVRTFHAKDWARARAGMIEAVATAHKADPTRQDVILAEDPSTYRTLSLSWSDKANFKPRLVHTKVPHLNKIMAKPKIEREFRVFAANDEKHEPKVGDAVVLFWPSVKKGSEAKMKGIVSNKMFAMLKADKHDRDSFAARDMKDGRFLGVAISPWEQRKARLVSKMNAELKLHHRTPVKTETFRVISVYLE